MRVCGGSPANAMQFLAGAFLRLRASRTGTWALLQQFFGRGVGMIPPELS